MTRGVSPNDNPVLERIATWPGFAAILAAYIGLHFALRLILSPTVGVDDVAEAIFAQSLQWTYYPRQPPLYTWLLWATFQVFGVSVAAVAFLKYALAAAGYLFFWLSACRIFPDRRLSLLAALSLSLIYAIGYGIHVGFTNTVLLIAACGATLYALLRVVQDGHLADYLALGLSLGVGFLSKWGYPAFAAPLLVAATLQQASRRRLADIRILAALAVAVALVGPYLTFGFQGAAVAHVFNGTMREGTHAVSLAGIGDGLSSLFVAIVMFLAPLWMLAVVVFPRILGARARAASSFDARRFFEHFFLLAGAAAILGVFLLGITHFKSRWMHPLLILFPLYLACLVEDAGFSARQLRIWLVLAATAAAAVVGARLAQDLAGPPWCGKCRLFKPYPELADAIRSRGFSSGTIVAGDEHIAGNFRVAFPDARVATSVYAFYVPPPRAFSGQCLVVWDAGQGPEMPLALSQFLKSAFRADAGPGPVQSVEAQYRRGDPRRLALDFMILPGTGRCH